MQLYHRPLAPREIDHELLWLAVSGGAFLSLTIWFAAQWPLPQCVFHSFTGLPCLTCGATRSALQFFHGHFAAAWRFNPLAFLAFCGVIAFDLYALAVLTTRAPRLRLGKLSRGEKLLARWAIVIPLAANWLYLLTARPF